MINTYMKPDGDKYTMKRADYTLNFIKKHFNVKRQKVTCLDIGPKNPVGDKICNILKIKCFNTTGDLDLPGWITTGYITDEWIIKNDLVICLEMMEHLMSPKFFLVELKRYVNTNSQIIFSYPSRPKWLWTRCHFHEYDRKRFIYLLNECGYEVLDWKRVYFQTAWWRRLKGIRPFFRQFVNFDNLVYAKLKGE